MIQLIDVVSPKVIKEVFFEETAIISKIDQNGILLTFQEGFPDYQLSLLEFINKCEIYLTDNGWRIESLFDPLETITVTKGEFSYTFESTSSEYNRHTGLANIIGRMIDQEVFKINPNLNLELLIKQAKLKKLIATISSQNTGKIHLNKVGEECSELLVEIFDYQRDNKVPDKTRLVEEMSDVLNTIDVYMYGYDITSEDIIDYRISQLAKHVKD